MMTRYKQKLIFSQEVSEEDLPLLTKKMLKSLQPESPFCLFLDGPVGAGKTTLCRHLLYALGLNQEEPVTSPTYSYFNQYEIKEKKYAHCDLYRLKNQELMAEEVEICNLRKFSGFMVEWPQISSDKDLLIPTHKLNISHLKADKLKRKMQFFALY